MRIWFPSVIRVVEIVIVFVLAAILLWTYRELSLLRKIPVALPNYEFDAQPRSNPERVTTRGTWIAQQGPPEALQTTTIECRKDTMQCIESAAVVVFVGDKGVMESVHTTFDVEAWDDKSITTKQVQGPCADRKLTLNLAEKRATSRVSAGREGGKCTATPERTLELVAGYKFREELQKSK